MKKIKRLLSITLILGLLAALVIPAAAYPQISVNQGQTVSVADNETAAIFEFKPTKTGYYSFRSYDQGSSDPCGYITDSNNEMLAYNDDTEDGDNNFEMSVYLFAGSTYYLCATSYSGAAQYSVEIKQQVSATSVRFADTAIFGVLGSVCYPEVIFSPAGCMAEQVSFTSSDSSVVYTDDEGAVYFISPGTVTLTARTTSGLTATITATTTRPPVLELNDLYQFDASRGNQYVMYTATASGWYGITSSGDELDPYVSVYDYNLQEVAFDDDSLGNCNFFASFYMEAGESRYIELQSYNRTGSCGVMLQKLGRAASIYIEEPTITAYLGGFLYLEPKYSPVVARPENLTWTTNNASVAKVDQYGYVDLMSKGTAIIKVTSESGKTDSVTINVIGSPTDSDLAAWGICGPQLQWKLNNSGVLTITGSGDMYDLQYAWQDYASQVKQVVLPSGITGIGENAFNGCVNLTSITLPNGVKRIGNGAFTDCTKLAQVTLPDSVEEIGYAAFRRCSALTQLRLPAKLTQLGLYAFADCTSLTSVSGGNYKRLSGYCFSECTKLSQVTLPDNLETVGDFAFYACPLQSITLPSKVKTIGHSAFEGCQIRSLELPETVTAIYHCAFLNCPILEITIGEKVNYLGDDLFQNGSLETITFLGGPPAFSAETFSSVRAVANYPAADSRWTAAVRQNYGGVISWHPYGIVSASIAGQVTVTGSAEITVELRSQDQTLTTTCASSYRFDEVPFGTYILTVTAPGHAPKSQQLELITDTTMNVTLYRYGDVTADGKTNLGDVARIFSHVRKNSPITDEYLLQCADVNGDGKINIADVSRVFAHTRNKNPLY